MWILPFGGVNSAVMILEGQISAESWPSLTLGALGVELLAYMVTLCLAFLGTTKSQPAMYESAHFSTSSPTRVIFRCFDCTHPSSWELVFTVVLICIFLMTIDIWHFLMWLLATCIYPLEKYLFKSFLKIRLSFCCWLAGQAYLRDITGLVPDHFNKAKIATKQAKFCSPSAHTSSFPLYYSY